jgi:hypothetical protein
VQTAVETPLAVETPIEPVVEKTDPSTATPVSPILVADREPLAQQETQSIAAEWSTFQPTKKPRREVPKEIWKRPVVIGVSLVGVIGVFVLVISMMSSGDADPVASNTAGRISAETPEPEPQPQPQPDPVPADLPVIELPSIINTIGMTLNKIPAGTFTMGSPETEKDRIANEHQHKVTISKPFYMQTTEVTQGQWKAVMGTEPWKGEDYIKEGANYAAVYVSWNDAVAYCKKLSEKEGKTYRLPTEAEWEYACRAGTKTAWSFGDDEKVLGDYAWYEKNAYDADEHTLHRHHQHFHRTMCNHQEPDFVTQTPVLSAALSRY